MLYDEFLKGVKCRDNENNYKVYKTLESLYMTREDLSKEDIYKSAKLLVDNSLSERDETRVDEYNAKIESLNELIESYKKDIEFYNWLLDSNVSDDEIKRYKRMKKYYKDCIRDDKESIRIYKKLIKSIEEI